MIILAILSTTTKTKKPMTAAMVIIMAMGCMAFAIGQILGENKKRAAVSFGIVNIWILSLIPISCIFNGIQGMSGGYWWTFTPIPQLGNSIIAYGISWLSYFMICIVFDIIVLKRAKRG